MRTFRNTGEYSEYPWVCQYKRVQVSRSCPSPTCHRKDNFPPWDRSHEIPDSGHDDRIQFDYGALKLWNVHFVR